MANKVIAQLQRSLHHAHEENSILKAKLARIHADSDISTLPKPVGPGDLLPLVSDTNNNSNVQLPPASTDQEVISCVITCQTTVLERGVR